MPSAVQQLSLAAAAGAAAKQVDIDIQQYQKARNVFINAIKEHLQKDDGGVTLQALIRNDIVALLCCPLAADPVQGIQIEALRQVGLIGKRNLKAAQAVTQCGVVDSVVLAQTHENPRIQEAANQSLRRLTEAGPEAAQRVLDTGMLHCIRQQLDGTDSGVKETALDAVASLAWTSADLARTVVEADLVAPTVQHLSSPHLPPALLAAACAALTGIASHDATLARKVADAGAVAPVVAILRNRRVGDPKLVSAALRCLTHIAQHETAVASEVVAAGAVAPATQYALDDLNSSPRRAATALLQQIATRTPHLAEAVASDGCVSALVQSLKCDSGSPHALPAVTALAHIGSFAPPFAKAVIDAGGLSAVVREMSSSHSGTCSACAWAVLHMAAHGPAIADLLASAGVLTALLHMQRQCMLDEEGAVLAQQATEEVVKHCTLLTPLLTLIDGAVPDATVCAVLKRAQRLMADSVTGRREFVTSGALLELQRMESGLNDRGRQLAQDVSGLFPVEVVSYYKQAAGK